MGIQNFARLYPGELIEERRENWSKLQHVINNWL